MILSLNRSETHVQFLLVIGMDGRDSDLVFCVIILILLMPTIAIVVPLKLTTFPIKSKLLAPAITLVPSKRALIKLWRLHALNITRIPIIKVRRLPALLITGIAVPIIATIEQICVR